MPLLAVLVVVLVVATPIFAILAYSRVQRLTEELRSLRLQDQVSRIYSVEQRLAAIEKAATAAPVGGAQPPPTAAPSASPTAPSIAPPPRVILAPQPVSVPAAQEPLNPAERTSGLLRAGVPPVPSLSLSRSSMTTPPSIDLEALIGGRWLNRIGILALIIAVSFFLKYAFDNNWIGPSGRVAIGILLGAAMLPWSQWLLGKGYSYFSEGIAALGQATLLLSVWAGCRYYTLFSPEVGFAGMVIVTAVMAAVALGRNSERIALLSLLGGFLTPLLVSTGKDEQVVLFTYLLILGAGLLVIAARRDWRSLAPLSFVLTQLYFWGWYESFYRTETLERTIVFATLFFLLYLVLPVLRAVRFSSLDAIGMFLVLLNSFAYLGALYVTLWPQDRWPLTLLVLALSAGHVVLARFVPPPKAGESPLTRSCSPVWPSLS